MPSICQAYSKLIPSICQAYSKYIPSICQAYSKYIPSICQAYSKHMPSLFQAYSKHIPSIFPAYAMLIHQVFSCGSSQFNSKHMPRVFRTLTKNMISTFQSAGSTQGLVMIQTWSAQNSLTWPAFMIRFQTPFYLLFDSIAKNFWASFALPWGSPCECPTAVIWRLIIGYPIGE